MLSVANSAQHRLQMKTKTSQYNKHLGTAV